MAWIKPRSHRTHSHQTTLGVRLLERTRRGIELTECGRAEQATAESAFASAAIIRSAGGRMLLPASQVAAYGPAVSSGGSGPARLSRSAAAAVQLLAKSRSCLRWRSDREVARTQHIHSKD
jgi:hypothetical protein